MFSATPSRCLATLIASTGSRQGKTVLTAALARRYSREGRRVQIFKVGPDYLDPTILQSASGQTVYNLDLWMMGEDHCRSLLHQGAACNDVILVESLMGLHDHEPSNAHLARLFNLPVTLIINVAKFAQTAAAVVEGMEKYGPAVSIDHLIGNRVGSDNHDRLMHEALGERYTGSLRRDDRMTLPERHLGLVPGNEHPDLDHRLDDMVAVLDECRIDPGLREMSFSMENPTLPPEPLLAGKTIAIARDAAFSFIYPANIELLESMGASAVFFSPLANDPVPSCDALWVPGGYPERYLARLTQAGVTRKSMQAFQDAQKPILAECGGMMALCNHIDSRTGERGYGFSLLDAECTMQSGFQSVGLQCVNYGQGEIRGHSFHHSLIHWKSAPSLFCTRQNGERGEAVIQCGNMTLTYLHHYFPSNPKAIAALLS